MPWTHNLKVRYLIQLPWTIAVTRDSAGGYLAEVAELPFLLASGNCEKDAAQHLFDGLWTALDAMLEYGDAPPVPAGTTLPWEEGKEPATAPKLRVVDGELAGEAWTLTASAVTQSLQLRR